VPTAKYCPLCVHDTDAMGSVLEVRSSSLVTLLVEAFHKYTA
jgi:hypothetical protein